MKTNRIHNFLLLMTVWAGLVGCGQQNTQDQVVTWAQLRVLDELSEKAINHSEAEGGSLQEMAVELFAAAKMVSLSEPPTNAKHAEQVVLLQSDLTGLIGDEISSLNKEELTERIDAIHTVAVKLMEAAGMPHVHNHDHEDHTGHNH